MLSDGQSWFLYFDNRRLRYRYGFDNLNDDRGQFELLNYDGLVSMLYLVYFC